MNSRICLSSGGKRNTHIQSQSKRKMAEHLTEIVDLYHHKPNPLFFFSDIKKRHTTFQKSASSYLKVLGQHFTFISDGAGGFRNKCALDFPCVYSKGLISVYVGNITSLIVCPVRRLVGRSVCIIV